MMLERLKMMGGTIFLYLCGMELIQKDFHKCILNIGNMDELDIDGFISSMMNGKGWISFMSSDKLDYMNNID